MKAARVNWPQINFFIHLLFFVRKPPWFAKATDTDVQKDQKQSADTLKQPETKETNWLQINPDTISYPTPHPHTEKQAHIRVTNKKKNYHTRHPIR